MLINDDLAYWITISHLPGWKTERINQLIIKVMNGKNISWADFFSLDKSDYKKGFDFTDKEINDLAIIRNDIPNNSFLAEDLLSQGYELITINSPYYSKVLKENLKIKYSPPLLYVKGNKHLLNEDSIAIVGSRNASNISLEFTDNIARLASGLHKVVVSGFVKGVDKQALDSAIKYKGHSIIVLPQGIMTFASGFKKYYSQIVDGDVLVLSTFYPKAVWSTGLAMARNPIIYGLAKEIYVAQSSDSGGTWAGVVDGLRKGRKIYVRQPNNSEKCANNLLIQKGAIAVDFNGTPISEVLHVHENIESYNQQQKSVIEQIIEVLQYGELTSKQITEKLKLQISTNEVTNILKSNQNIEIISKNPYKFRLKKGLMNSMTLF